MLYNTSQIFVLAFCIVCYSIKNIDELSIKAIFIFVEVYHDPQRVFAFVEP